MSKYINILLIVLFGFCCKYLYSQNTGTAVETSLYNDDSPYKFAKLYYEKFIDIVNDEDYGNAYRTQYNIRLIYDEKPTFAISICNFKYSDIIQIYIFPYYNWIRVDELFQSYEIKPSEIEGLTYQIHLTNQNYQVKNYSFSFYLLFYYVLP